MTLVTRVPIFGDPVADFDEQLYTLIGRATAHGAVPYVDLWDRKPVGLFLIYALADAVGGPGPIAYQLLAIAFCLVGGWLTYRLGRRILPNAPPANAGLAACLYPLMMAIYGSQSGQSEIFYTPLLLAMAELVLVGVDRAGAARTWWPMLLAMALGGVALQVKYSVLPPCLLFGAFALWRLRAGQASMGRLGLAAVAFAGLGLAPTVAAAGFYAWRGQFDTFAFANFVSIGLRAPMPWQVTLGRQFSDLAPLLVIAGGGVLFAARARRPMPLAWRLALAWLGAATAGLFMGTTIYTYYYAALVPPVVLVALPMFDMRRRANTVILAGVLVWMLATANPVRRLADAARDRAAVTAMADLLRPAVGDPAHPLYVYDGPTALYRLTGSALPSRFIYPDHLNNALEARALPVAPQAEIARILAHQPGAIVTSPVPVTLRNRATEAQVQAAIARDYVPGPVITLLARPMAIYLRRPPPKGAH